MRAGDSAEIDIASWVALALPEDRKSFREAIHIALSAIGASRELSASMVMKGGILLAIRYQSSRFTRDIDFSTREPYTQGVDERVVTIFREELIVASERLGYDTVCRLQSYELRPNALAAPNFPTLKMRVGYAKQSNRRAFDRLIAGSSPQIVEVDFSFNEAVLEIDEISLSADEELRVYSLVNVFAEKLRSLMQQPARGRNRRQDVYDLHYLLMRCTPLTETERRHLVVTLIDSCAARGIKATAIALEDPVIREMARAEYGTLADDIEGALPDFDVAFELVAAFYGGLPWPATV